MRTALPAAAGFSLRNGTLHGSSPFVYVADTVERAARGPSGAVLILAEPVDLAPGDSTFAANAITGVRRTLVGVDASDAIAAICSAYSVANARLLAENRRRGTLRRLFLGLTTVVVCGDDLFVAHVPPGQLLMCQPGSLFSCPPLASWQSNFQADATYELPNPLGLRTDLQPRIYYSRVTADQLIVAVSSRIAASLSTSPHELSSSRSIDGLLTLVLDSWIRSGRSAGWVAAARAPQAVRAFSRAPRRGNAGASGFGARGR
jgi:hypothetical protein